MKPIRTLLAALGLALMAIIPATVPAEAAPGVGAAVEPCVIVGPQVSNSRFCARVDVGRPTAQWYSLGQVQSRDGKKYKLSIKTYGAGYYLVVNWTNLLQVGGVYTDNSPTRAEVKDTAGNTWGWSIEP